MLSELKDIYFYLSFNTRAPRAVWLILQQDIIGPLHKL